MSARWCAPAWTVCALPPATAAALAAAVRALPQLEQSADPAAMRAEALEQYGEEQNYRQLTEIYGRVMAEHA